METEGLRVLLVDDEKSMQDILTVTLQPAGYDVYAVGTGAEALQKFPLTRPDLILLDLFLPDVDGKKNSKPSAGMDDFAHHCNVSSP